jgi:hypothetical protein
MRDEFDPIHDNQRVGWYQRPLRPSRAKVVEQFQDLGEEELRDVVLEILMNPEFRETEDFPDIVGPIAQTEKRRKGKSIFIIRGPTGRKAEDFFVNYHRTNRLPHPGLLEDRRDKGCGYDFSITDGSRHYFVEVKGLDKDVGGIAFTSKEWDVARQKGCDYYLAIVRNLSANPQVQFIRDPANNLNPRKGIFTTVQVQWYVGDAELSSVR